MRTIRDILKVIFLVLPVVILASICIVFNQSMDEREKRKRLREWRKNL